MKNVTIQIVFALYIESLYALVYCMQKIFNEK